MALFGKEAELSRKLEDTSLDIATKKIPVRGTIGYELELIYRMDNKGYVEDIFLSANVPRSILAMDGFTLLRNRMSQTMTLSKIEKGELFLSSSEYIGSGLVSHEHVIFRRR
jgi:hypothetical protein